MIQMAFEQLARRAVFGAEHRGERMALAQFAGKVRQISTYIAVGSGLIILSGLVTSHFWQQSA